MNTTNQNSGSTFISEAGELNVKVKSNVVWEFALCGNTDNWLSIKNDFGEKVQFIKGKNTKFVTLVAEKNETGVNRTCSGICNSHQYTRPDGEEPDAWVGFVQLSGGTIPPGPQPPTDLKWYWVDNNSTALTITITSERHQNDISCNAITKYEDVTYSVERENNMGRWCFPEITTDGTLVLFSTSENTEGERTCNVNVFCTDNNDNKKLIGKVSVIQRGKADESIVVKINNKQNPTMLERETQTFNVTTVCSNSDTYYNIIVVKKENGVESEVLWKELQKGNIEQFFNYDYPCGTNESQEPRFFTVKCVKSNGGELLGECTVAQKYDDEIFYWKNSQENVINLSFEYYSLSSIHIEEFITTIPSYYNYDERNDLKAEIYLNTGNMFGSNVYCNDLYFTGLNNVGFNLTKNLTIETRTGIIHVKKKSDNKVVGIMNIIQKGLLNYSLDLKVNGQNNKYYEYVLFPVDDEKFTITTMPNEAYEYKIQVSDSNSVLYEITTTGNFTGDYVCGINTTGDFRYFIVKAIVNGVVIETVKVEQDWS